MGDSNLCREVIVRGRRGRDVNSLPVLEPHINGQARRCIRFRRSRKHNPNLDTRFFPW